MANHASGVDIHDDVESPPGFLAAVWQGLPALRDPVANLEVLDSVLAAASDDLELLMFPELFLQGYDAGAEALRRLAVPRPASLEALRCSVGAASLRRTGDDAPLRCAVALPYAEMGSDGALYNSCAVFHCDGVLAFNYRKSHLWDDGNASSEETYERAIFSAGGADSLSTFDLRLASRVVRTGVLICFDIEFPEPARCLALRGGAELLIVPTALAIGPVAHVMPCMTVPARAQENHVHILYSNFAGCSSSGFLHFCGRSAIIGPDGLDLARAGSGDEVLLSARVDRSAFSSAIRRNDYLALRRRDLYGEFTPVCKES